MGILMQTNENEVKVSPKPHRKLLRLLALAVVTALACLLACDEINSRLQASARVFEAPLTIVKKEPSCFMCGSTQGYASEVVTYSYVAGGRVLSVADERENSKRRDARHYFAKICYEPGNPNNAEYADADYKCGQ